MKKMTGMTVVLAASAWALAAGEWVEPMKKVHAKFTGQAGTVAQYGDSITITMAFFAPLRGEIRNLPPDLKPAHAWLGKHVAGRCWEAWKGADWGNNGSTTSDWGAKNMDRWLKRMNPEVALIMWGTNDTNAGPKPPKYTENMRAVVQKCLDNGTIPILYTIPPVGNQAGNAARTKHVESFVTAVRGLAKEMKVPLIDFYKEIMARRPNNFAKTLLGDNLHPSYPKAYQRDFSDKALTNSGYTLRNYLTLKKLHEVHLEVLVKVKSARVTDLDMVWGGAKHKGLPAIRVLHDGRRPSSIDGYLGEPVWKNPRTLRFHLLDGDPTEPKHASAAKIYTSPLGIFIAFHHVDGDADNIVTQKRTDDDDGIFKDDCGEVFLCVGAKATAKNYYHLVINASGSTWTAFGRDKNAWNPAVKVGAKVLAKSKRGAGGWDAEISIPWSDVKLPTDKKVLSGPWRINITRTRQPRKKGEYAEETALAPTEHTSSHVPEKFAYAWLEFFGGKLPTERE